MNKNELYAKAKDTYGLEAQLIVAIEECSELQKELTKYLRGKGSRKNIAEEVADVEIMIEQIRYFFDLGISVEMVKKIKLERLEKRVNNG